MKMIQNQTEIDRLLDRRKKKKEITTFSLKAKM